MDNTEVIFFLHSLREPKYFKTLEKETFKNDYVSNFYWLVKDFYKKYGEIPINIENNSLEQVEEILRVEPKYFKIDPDIPDDKNKSAFLSNCQTILNNNYGRYNRKAIDDNMSAWVDWENFQEAYIKASQYMKSFDVNPNNVRDVITRAKEILNGFSLSNTKDEDEDYDFFDADFHAEDEELTPTKSSGMVNFDLLCNSKGNGIKVGNLILLVGAPNVGKSIVLGNLGVSIAENGSNVLFISLEMDARDMKERLSGRAFGIKMDDYESRRKDMADIIENYEQDMLKRGLSHGKLLLKRMYSPTHMDIHRAVSHVEQEQGIKIHFVVLDYLTEMGNEYGIRPDNAFNTYMYHKTNCKGLFDCAGEGEYTTISAHQSSNIKNDATDIFLDDLSESKGILHSPDSVIGIIQGDIHKQSKKYFLKSIKARHSKYKDYYVEFDIDYSRMYLKEGGLYSKEEYGGNGIVAQVNSTESL